MLRVAEDTDDTYVPYALTNQQLTDASIKVPTELTSAVDLDSITDAGFYTWGSSAPTHSPESNTFCIMEVLKVSGNTIQRVINSAGGPNMYLRRLSGSPATWKNWMKFTGTEIVPASNTALNPETREASEEDPEPVVTKSTRKSTK
jgi:hypothetical protein